MDPTGLTLAQPADGYRFSLDPFLLASFVRPRLRERVLDLGAGVGVIALALARSFPTLRVFALEIQRDLALLAGENARKNNLVERCFTICGDAREASALFPPEHFHRVVANPPFRALRTGHISPHPGRALARQELGFTLDDLARTASSLLRNGGALDIIHLAERLPEIIRTFSIRHLEVKILRLVAPRPLSRPDLVLLTARKGGKPGLTILPQLAIRDDSGTYSPEVSAALLRPASPTSFLESALDSRSSPD